MKTIPINTPEDFEDVSDDLLTKYVFSYNFENACVGYANYHEGVEVWSTKGNQLYERYIERLKKIGQKRFPEKDLTIRSSWVELVPPDTIDE